MRPNNTQEAKSTSIPALILQLIVLAILLVLSFFCYLTFQPQPLGDISGYNSAVPAKDLTKVMDASLKLQRKMSISEEELNVYLKKRLRINQGGFLKKHLKANGVAVRLTAGQMEIIIHRVLRGQPHTVSMFLATSVKNDSFGKPQLVLERTGARLGKLKLPPAYVLLVQDSFLKLEKALKKEIEMGFHGMAKIQFEDGAIILDPNPQVLSGSVAGNL